MADQLAAAKGAFVMSINDVPEIPAMFAWAQIDEVSTTYTVAGKGATKAAELLISRV